MVICSFRRTLLYYRGSKAMVTQDIHEVDTHAANGYLNGSINGSANGSVPVLVQKTSPTEMAKAAGLRYVSDRQPGYHRRRRGRGFTYVDWEGKAIQDAH